MPEPSSFLDEVIIDSSKTGSKCTMGVLLDSLPDDLRVQVEEAMATPAAAGTSIARVLTARGYPCRAGVVQRHRRGGCTCV